MIKNRKLYLRIFLYIVAILLLAGAVYLFMHLAIPTLPNLNASTWLGFWGSYLGGAIGCLPALAALYDNREEARRQHEETKTDRRLEIMPVFSCKTNVLSRDHIENISIQSLSGLLFLNPTEGFCDTFLSGSFVDYVRKMNAADSSYLFISLELTNIGFGPALNVFLSSTITSSHRIIPINSIGANDNRTLIVGLNIPPNASNEQLFKYNISISFTDVFGNAYSQDQPLVIKKGAYFFSEISFPKYKQP